MKEYQQGTPEWVEFRKNHIGASDAPVIIGVSPWKTPLQLWEEKLGLRTPEFTRAMAYGRETEEEARASFEKDTGLTVFPKVILHPRIEWMMASVDGIDIEGENVVEIKCPGIEDHEYARMRKIPIKYYPQLQHTMAVCEIQSIYYYSYRVGDHILIEVARDEEYITKLMDKEYEFWKCLQDLKQPDYSDMDHVQRNDDLWNKKAERWRFLNESLDSIKQEEAILRQELITMCGSKNCAGGGIRMTRSIRKGTVDYSSIDALKEIDLEKFRKQPIESWRITVDKD